MLAVKDDQRVCIEVETGKSDVVSNVRNGLRSGFDKVVVVATSQEAMGKVERALGKEGLLIAGRVDIVLQDNSRERDRSRSRDLLMKG